MQPTCHVNHLPPYLKNFDAFKAKGVDVVAVISVNDPFVLSGWTRIEGVAEKVSLNDQREVFWLWLTFPIPIRSSLSPISTVHGARSLV